MGTLTIRSRGGQFLFEIRNHGGWKGAPTLPYVNQFLDLVLLRESSVSLRLTHIRGGDSHSLRSQNIVATLVYSEYEHDLAQEQPRLAPHEGVPFEPQGHC